MTDILKQIIAEKKEEVRQRKKERPVEQLKDEALFNRPARSLRQSLLDPSRNGIIAEYKRRSPSKGVINDRDSVESVTASYAAFGASGVSILTDGKFFGGSLNDLVSARNIELPILRKDFMIDEYQLVEAKAYGADVILLIAACLTPGEAKELAAAAGKLGLEVLLELHDESELEHICEEVHLVGVNNRNLRTFEVDLGHSVRMAEKIGGDFIRIAESGINDVKNLRFLKAHGFKGFLIGEHFMRQEDPGQAFREFSKQL